MTYAGYNWTGKKWRGINAYPVAPMTPDLKVDYEAYRRPAGDLMARYKEVTRLTGLIPCSSVRPPKADLTPEEKKQIFEATKKCGLIGANASAVRKAA